MSVKVKVSGVEQKNQLPFNMAVELLNDSNTTEECVVSGYGYKISIISGKKKKESLLSS